MARTIAAFFMLCAVALVSGMLTVKLLTFTAETMMRVAASAPIETYDFKPGYVIRLPLITIDGGRSGLIYGEFLQPAESERLQVQN